VPPAAGCPATGPAYPEVTRAICLVPSASFPQAPRYALPVHLCRFRVRSCCQRCFQDPRRSRPNPIRADTHEGSSRLAGRGMFAPFPSATAFALALGAGSPCADWPCAGTLGLPAGGVLALLVATHVRIRTSRASTGPRGPASPAWGTLRYRLHHCRPTASAGGLSPATFSPRDG
jgi:hypothetical protein